MSKPRPNRLGMYADVQQILDAALASGGGSYKLPTHGQAVHWRQRAYMFRKLYAEVHHIKSTSRYDVIVMPRVPADSSTVTFKIQQIQGEFTPGNGAIPRFTEVSPEDDLLDFAENFSSSLDDPPL